jgi:predicted acyltransferase
MILGLAAGRWLVADSPRIPIKRLLLAGGIGIAAGLLLHFAGICPIVKRIWTPSWTLFSGGLCFLFLAAFAWIIDVRGYKKWAFPLVVIGMNSMAAYLMAHLFESFLADSLRINLGSRPFQIFGTGVEPLMRGAAILGLYWLMLFWMYRRKIFLRV